MECTLNANKMAPLAASSGESIHSTKIWKEALYSGMHLQAQLYGLVKTSKIGNLAKHVGAALHL